MSGDIDIATMRAAFVQAQAQIENGGTYTPVVVIAKDLALSLLDEIERLRLRADHLDPLHPPMGVDPQPFRDWRDFLDRVAHPLIDGKDDDTVRAAMTLYRQANPYFVCVCLVMAAAAEPPPSTSEEADHG